MIAELEVIYLLTAPDTNKHYKRADFGFDLHKFLRMLGIQTWIVKERLVGYENKQTKTIILFPVPTDAFSKGCICGGATTQFLP